MAIWVIVSSVSEDYNICWKVSLRCSEEWQCFQHKQKLCWISVNAKEGIKKKKWKQNSLREKKVFLFNDARNCAVWLQKKQVGYFPYDKICRFSELNILSYKNSLLC